MGNQAGKREANAEKANKNGETNRGECEKRRNLGELSQAASEDSDVFGEADASQNNGTSSRDTAVTDSKSTGDPKNAWQDARPADPGRRPHLTRLFSRDAPGREDNTFKDRPSESDELQTIHEDTAAAPEGLDVMASQKRPSQRHGSKYLATAGTADHARPSFLPRHRDTGILDSIGRFFGGDRGAPKRGSGKVPWLTQSRSPLPSQARQPGLCSMYKVRPSLVCSSTPGPGLQGQVPGDGASVIAGHVPASLLLQSTKEHLRPRVLSMVRMTERGRPKGKEGTRRGTDLP